MYDQVLARDQAFSRARPGRSTSLQPGRQRLACPGYYCRAMATRISLPVSVIRSPDRSMVAVYRVPVKRNGAW
jgi:hypothetical protein